MLKRDDFVGFILEGPKVKAGAKADTDTGPTLPEGFEDFGFSSEETQEEIETGVSFARQLMEASGFGSAEYLERSEVILGNDPAARYLPEKVFYWPKKDNRPYQTLLFELEQPGRQLLKAPLFKPLKGQEILEDAISRLVQMSLKGFEKGGEKRTAAVKSGKQNETLCIVSVQDDRLESDKPLHLVCLGTQSQKLNSLETYHIREEARLWERQLAVDHLSRLYDRHFSKLDGEKWQDSFITGEERKLAQSLMDECIKKKPEKSTIQKCVVNLLEEIAKTFGLRKKAGGKSRLTAFELPKDHDIGVDPESREKQGGENPFEGMILRDEKSRLLGYIIYCLDQKKDAGKLRKYLARHNRFHNVLVIYPDGTEAVLELWQGMKMLEGKLTKQGSAFEGEGKIVNLLSRFFVVSKAKVRNPEELAQELAYRARYLRRLALKQLQEEKKSGLLRDLYNAFKEALIHDQTEDEFADSYAQTLTYGLLSARWISKDIFASKGQRFTREKALEHFPPSSPFLRDFFSAVLKAHSEFKLNWLLDDIADLLDRTDIGRVFETGNWDRGDWTTDTVIHFYEPFLAAYDAKLKKKRGVYYTPRPIVYFIVRNVDEILRIEFGLEDGLADATTWGEMIRRHEGLKLPENVKLTDFFVQILDIASGTGTFMVEVIHLIHETMKAKWKVNSDQPAKLSELWNNYVSEKLLPRLYGFELIMAPYAIAHMKIGLKLSETGYRFRHNERVNLFLTNTLEGPSDSQKQMKMFTDGLADEARSANDVKLNILPTVIIGNPPYSKSSANRSVESEALVRDYKSYVKSEKNVQPLSDDYLKFMGYSQKKSSQLEKGIIALITNRGYIAGLIHRGVRRSLLRDFDHIRICDLHGDSNVGESVPAGEANENVFDIQQGVAISFLTNSLTKDKKVQLYDLWGTRECKYSSLLSQSVENIGWIECEPAEPNFFFSPLNDISKLRSKIVKFVPLNELFQAHGGGIKTHRDNLVIDFDRESLKNKIFRFLTSTDGRKMFSEYGVIIEESEVEELIHELLYRPFDQRYIFYHPALIDRPRKKIMRHMLAGQNLGLIGVRQVPRGIFAHVFAARSLTEMKTASHDRGSNIFPIYQYPDKEFVRNFSSTKNISKTTNIKPKHCLALAESVELEFLAEGNGNLTNNFGPEDFLHFIYAILHSAQYRTIYSEDLRVNFAKIPLYLSQDHFRALCYLGADLIAMHLLEDDYQSASWKGINGPLSKPMTRFTCEGSTAIANGHPKYKSEKVYINKQCYFEGIPEKIWNFYIGGYQVCHKWLKDRGPKKGNSGRILTEEDIAHYQKIIVAIKETIRLMAEIDEIIEKHGGWPDAFVTKIGDN